MEILCLFLFINLPKILSLNGVRELPVLTLSHIEIHLFCVQTLNSGKGSTTDISLKLHDRVHGDLNICCSRCASHQLSF